MKLTVGLGNYETKYNNTRHNLGFLILDNYVKHQNSENQWSQSKNLQCLICKPSSELLLAEPQVFMNNSGKAVKKLVDFYKIKLSDILVIHDDLDLNLSDFKLQFGRSFAGHKGVESITDNLNSQKFWRLRIGIGRPPKGMEEEYVLREFEESERKVIENLLPEIFGEIDNWISSNAKVQMPNQVQNPNDKNI